MNFLPSVTSILSKKMKPTPDVSDHETLDKRLRTVERALTDGDPVPDLSDSGTRQNMSEISTSVDDIESRLDELDAAVQAIRGYVGTIRSVNADVERRADAALAKAETRQRESSPAQREPPIGPRRKSDLSAEEPVPEIEVGVERDERSVATNSKQGSIFTRLREVL